MHPFFLLILIVFSGQLYGAFESKDWDFTPIIYSRGGMTLKDDFSKRGPTKNDTTNEINYNQSWNLGPYGEETNAISPALTELTMEIVYKKQVKYVYGVDVKNNTRFYEHDRTNRDEGTGLNERLNYVEFYNGPYSLWFGQRAYRGVGEYLTGTFPFDELNMLGGGVRIERVGPFNLEFAYGVKEGNDEDYWDNSATGGTATDQNEIEKRTINMLVSKIEYPLTNGMIKTNFQFHRNNALYATQRTNSYIAGVQWQRWGDQVLGGSLYNIIYVNYSHGHIAEGYMRSALDQTREDRVPSKLVVKYGGDLKGNLWGAFWNFEYHKHMGKEWPWNQSTPVDASWSYIDAYFRPLFVINPNLTWGVDYAQRIVLEDSLMTNSERFYHDSGATRVALMLGYNLKKRPFDMPNISLFVGRMIKDKATTFFEDDAAKRESNFIRLNYQISI